MKLNQYVNHWKNAYYKAYADIDNVCKSIEKHHYENLKYHEEGFIIKFLNILDGFHLALNNKINNEEIKNYLIGFEYTYKNLLNILKKEGVEETVLRTWDSFNEKKMKVVETIFQEKNESNRILDVKLNSYMLKDHLLLG